ncbi:hypothetical protein L4J28_000715 [Salmonella enterica]|nr:hypothetical protein [Salmonella enterica]
MKIFLTLLTCILFVSGCKPSEKNLISIGESVVRDSLNDPDSAKFNSQYYKYGDNGAYICGDVNYKNSFGGYDGKRKYYVYIEVVDGKLISHGTVTIIKETDKALSEVYKSLCK